MSPCRAAAVIALSLCFLTACEERPASPTPTAQQPTASEPTPEYRLAWGDLAAEPRFGDEALTDPAAVDPVLDRLRQDGAGIIQIIHASGRMIQAMPAEGGFSLDYADEASRLNMEFSRPATAEEVREAFANFATSEGARPTGPEWRRIARLDDRMGDR
jgi:hypothetical protein